VPRGDPVHGVGIAGYVDAVPGQLVSESYRPRAGGRGGRRQRGDSLPQLLGRADERLPEALAVLRVERRESLAATGVEHRQPLARGARLPDPAADRVEGADPGRRQAEAGGEPPRRRGGDPQPGEGARPEADRDPVDPSPAARCLDAALDLDQQRGGVARASLGGPEQGLPQDLAVAPGGRGGVRGRGVEADDEQRAVASSR